MKPFSMRVKACVVITLICAYLPGKGQYEGTIPKVTVVSPNEASLFKASERPVGNFSGTVPIDIPIYTVSAGNIQMPFSLNYHTGGIKVEEVASWVGLGWNLSGGGSITRLMLGVPDDYAAMNGYLWSSLKPSGFPGTSSTWLTNVDAICRNQQDIEPDLYYFSVNGLSGQFFFDEHGNVVLVEKSGIRITPVWQGVFQSGSQILGWILTDEKGASYYFGLDKAQSRTCVDYTNPSYISQNGYTNLPSGYPYSSTWHLMEIYDMNSENSMQFYYTNTSIYMNTRSAAYRMLQSSGTSACEPADFYADEVTITSNVQEWYLNSVVGGNDTLQLYMSPNRKDYGGMELDSLRISGRGIGLLKKFHFNYDYFSIPNAPTGYDNYYKRLKLKNVAEFGSSGTDSLTSKFDYIETVNLPSRMSRALDYWGFYNGQDYNWTLMPNGTYNYSGYALAIDNLADRRANGDYACANTLSRITFPTGGYRQFTYEGNQALLELNYQVQPDANYYTTRSLYANSWNMNPSGPQYQTSFTVNSYDGAAVWHFNLSSCCYCSNFSVKILDASGFNTLMTFSNQVNGSFNLPNGTYQVQFFFDIYNCTFDNFNAYWNELSLNTNTTVSGGNVFYRDMVNVGGIRIRQIADYDPVTGVTNSTQYTYNQFSDSTLTSGILVTPIMVAHSGGCANRDCSYVRLGTQSFYPLTTEGSSYVFYTDVRTSESGNGHIDRGYSFAFDQIGSMWDFPILPAGSQAWQRGKPLLETVYDQAGNLIKKTSRLYYGVIYPYPWDNNYGSFGPDSPNQFIQTSQMAWKVVGYYNGGVITSGCWGRYDMNGLFCAPHATFETTYGAGGSQLKETLFSYYSTDLNLPFLKQQKTFINNNRTREINYKYAFNSNSSFQFGLSGAEQTAKADLLSRNYLQPLETTATLTASGGAPTFVEGYKYGFGYFNGNNLHLYAIKHFTTLSDSIVMNYTQYDAHGNLAEQYKNNDRREVYLWGYNNSYPVAQVSGSDYNTVASYVNNSVLQAPSSDAALRSQLNNIRTGLAGTKAQVTTYTYAPLIGITSMTGPAGTTLYYEYDNHQRLIRIRDQNNNIIKKYNYNYAGN